ncbi:MAG TPA: hypothetical protein PK073_00395 [Ignavibacteriaceae bacterium]|jgi:hypothetical protein|nr:MAG: hypothetical protein BWY38_02188 [Ignavibacteria bacterium ADurb.Bin266]OQY72917.1 MAG: hypothetical protein B6D44_08860 [Ignavibacteriales bacterium UTCHB2]HQF41336.1 hypothetical protein [Ignavibacteriaceae bacterium]HQI41141.1 hypothetical protein [Ignavibacteriaceae bacterium]HQJ45100.1 hypothetical protein [Ignavibacteriaceae bacterium]
MKSIIIKASLIVIISFINIYAQLEEDWADYKISIPFIRVIDKRPLYEPSRYQKMVYPQVTTYQLSGYSYLLEVTISVHSKNKWFDQSVPVVFFTPDNKREIYYFNHERAPLKTNNLYTFICEITLKSTGYMQVGLMRKFSDSQELQEVYENGLVLQ